MSQKYYIELWRETQDELNRLFEEDTPNEEPIFDRESVVEALLVIYLRYVIVIRNLAACFDQMVQPQKRLVIRKLLDAAMCRLLEVKQEIVTVQFSEVLILDDVIHAMKITPEDAEITIPHFLLFDQRRRLAVRDRFLNHILSTMPVKAEMPIDIVMSHLEAIVIIQAHERARQGRGHFMILNELARHDALSDTKKAVMDDFRITTSAVICQSAIRQALAQNQARKMREEEFLWLNMMCPLDGFKVDEQRKWENSFLLKQIQQVNYEENYRLALRTIKEEIHENEANDQKENLVALIRQWFLEYRYSQKVFPDYPSEEVGGSNAIFKVQEEESENPSEERASKDAKPVEPKIEKKRDWNKLEDPMEKGWVLMASNIVESLKETSRFYDDFWRTRDETHNVFQIHDENIIREEKRAEVYEEVRIQVDELLREELKNLKLVVDGQASKKSKKKGKKRKKGKKKKGEKDITADRSFESIYEELVMAGIIKPAANVRLREFLGEFPLVSTSLREFEIPPVMSLYDVRRLITEYAIMPLGSPAVRELSPLFRSLLIAGPTGSGKMMLVNAICTETGANLIDLTATNLMGKYPGKEGLKMLMHLVFKVARKMQPTVILIQECEKMFMKKIAKDDLSEPKRIKVELNRAIKNYMTTENRIILIGITSAPYNAVTKQLCQMYEKIILIPKPEYGTRILLLKNFISKILGVHFSKRTDINFSLLAKLSDGHSAGEMRKICCEVITDQRAGRAKTNKIKTKEFVSSLARRDPVYHEEEESLLAWYATTPMGRKRAKITAEAMALLDPQLS